MKIFGYDVEPETLKSFSDYCAQSLIVHLTPEGLKYLIEEYDGWFIPEYEDWDTQGKECILDAMAYECLGRSWPLNMEDDPTVFMEEFPKALVDWWRKHPEYVVEDSIQEI